MDTSTTAETAVTPAADLEKSLDLLEVRLSELPRADITVKHMFTPGIYIREMSVPAGVMLTTMEHKTEHPFILSKGRVIINSGTEGEVIYEAPYRGITMPGTRRAAYAVTDFTWTTFHATDETDIEKIGEAILEPWDNKLIKEKQKLIPAWRESLPQKT